VRKNIISPQAAYQKIAPLVIARQTTAPKPKATTQKAPAKMGEKQIPRRPRFTGASDDPSLALQVRGFLGMTTFEWPAAAARG
jgi:hypothetical protein